VPLIALAMVLLIPIAFVLATPLMIVQRFRMGTARRPGRGWVATLNLIAVMFSVGVFVVAAAITTFWVAGALGYSLVGLCVGGLLGCAGLALTRWERTPGAFHYTPNRWLVLLITVAIAARLLYGFARAWNAWSADESGTSWVAAAGIAQSMAVGAAVLGYYAIYALGVWWRVRRHRRQASGYRGWAKVIR
jgi:hypothetical protein